MLLKIKTTYKDLVNFYAWGVKLFIFAVPLLSFYVSHSLFFPFITGRNFAFRIFVELSLALWLGLIALSRDYWPKWSKIGTALIIFLIVLGLANLFGVDPYHSFWSRYERMEGYIMFIHLGLFFFLLSSVLRTKKEWLILFNIFLIAGMINGIYAIFQRTGVVGESIQGGFRPDGFIGNPSYLAAYLVLVLGSCLILLFNTKGWIRNFYFGLALFFALVIFLTATRGSLLALLAGSFIFLVSYLLFRYRSIQSKTVKISLLVFLGFLIIAPLSFWFLKGADFIKNNELFSRFSTISFMDKTIKARFLIWNMSLQGFKERPILGWGQENYINVFSKYYDSRLYDQEPWFDRSHNIVFDWLINAGALGFTSFISIFSIAFLVLYFLIKKKALIFEEGLVISVIFLVYFIQNFFVFDNFNTYILVFVFLAYLNRLDLGIDSQIKDIVPKKLVPYSFMIFGSSLGLILTVMYFWNIKPILQAKGIINSLRATREDVNPIGKTLDSFKKSLGYNTFGNTETLEQLGKTTNSLIDQDFDVRQKSEFVSYSLSNLESYLQRFPNDIRLHLISAQLYGKANALDPSYLDKAKEHIQKALSLSPKKQSIYSILAENYLARKDYNGAIDTLKEAIAINSQNIEIYVNLGMVAVLADRNDIVRQTISEMMSLKEKYDLHTGEFAEDLVNIAATYIRTQKFDKAKDIFELAISYMPNNALYRANLAGLYLNQGMFEEAIEQIRKAAELEPNSYGELASEFEAKVLEYIKNRDEGKQ